MRRITPLLLTAALLLAGCSNSPAANTSASPSTTPTPTAAARAEVPWADYAAGVQTRIDELTATKDCAALQDEFDTADANNDAVAERTTHNNAALMTYIDESLRIADCY